MTESTTKHGQTFEELAIDSLILAQLKRKNFTIPTPIQHAAIPPAIAGQDIIGIAQTGTGKTLAFGIPMLQRLKKNGGHGLIIVPTRELALQVEETFLHITPALQMRIAVLIGGTSMYLQKQMIRKQPRIVIATPGRLIDHLERKTITLKTVKVLVLDEADRMLDMGFAPQINKILTSVPQDRQTMLFSATMPQNIVKLALTHMQLPIHIEMAPAGTLAANIEQELVVVRKETKNILLEMLLKEFHNTVLLFSRTKHGAKKITKSIQAMGHKTAEIHSDRSLSQRKEALQGFKNGKYRILVATDIAARGIDVPDIGLVINYDLPDNPEDYVHRIGRTGRAGRGGKAISFATPDQYNDVRNIEKLIKTALPIAEIAQHSVPFDQRISQKFHRSSGRRNHRNARRRNDYSMRRGG